MRQEPFVLERILNAPIERVWKAISDKEEMKQWYFDIADFRPEAGVHFTFEGGTEQRTYVHLCTVKEVIPHKKLSYSWRYEGYEGDSLVTFELFDEGDTTKLRLTHEGLETFPAATNPDLAPKNFAEGWSYIIGTSLPGFVDKGETE